MEAKTNLTRLDPAPAKSGGGTIVVKLGGLLLVVLVLVGIAAAAMPHVKVWLAPADNSRQESAKDKDSSARLADGDSSIIVLPQDVNERLGVKIGEIKKATESRRLELPGSLAPDTDYLVPVRCRFAGEVVELGRFPDHEAPSPTRFQTVRNSIQVHEGDLLAVVWSKDLGEKKNELIDALIKRRVDQKTLQSYEKLYRDGNLPAKSLLDAQFNVQSDQNAIRKAESTLRAWQLTDEEIKGIYGEADLLAERIDKGEVVRTKDEWKNWARVEIRAPFDGIILEKNITRGAIVDTSMCLFMIGDLSHLSVWAYAYEEDLPTLLALAKPIPWSIQIKNEPQTKPLVGTIREIRPIIDPNVHAALVKGQVDNPEGRLLSGQFISATVDIPPAPDELVIPTSALVEDGNESIVFIQPTANEPRYALRRVHVLVRGRESVHVNAKVEARDRSKPVAPLQPGDRIVIAGALEMWAAMKDLDDRQRGP